MSKIDTDSIIIGKESTDKPNSYKIHKKHSKDYLRDNNREWDWDMNLVGMTDTMEGRAEGHREN